MHHAKDISNDPELYTLTLERRGADSSVISQIITKETERKRLTTLVEENRAKVKQLSREVGQLKGRGEDASEQMAMVAKLKQGITESEAALEQDKESLQSLLLELPNLLANDVPNGTSEEDNVEILRKGTPKSFDFEVKDHVAVAEGLGMLDFEAASKLTGSRFAVYKRGLAKLERALINFMLNEHGDNGYEEIIPPFIVHERSLIGTSQLPKFKEDLFKLEGRDWYLIPTAEVPLTNLRREELFDGRELPQKFCAYTPCFRSEAGSYGKDTRGLIRLHQFNKVELVNIVEAHRSHEAHEDMIARACSILDKLELPYRGVLLCAGDIGFGAQRTVDLEVWLPAQNKYREISSISNCGAFQARRAGIRYRNAEGKPEFAHTLNGSGLAVGRTLVAILENYQNSDGSVTIPEVLRPYMGGLERLQ